VGSQQFLDIYTLKPLQTSDLEISQSTEFDQSVDGGLVELEQISDLIRREEFRNPA